MKKALLILLVTVTTVSSCKKNETNCAKTMEGLAGTYSLVKVEQGGGGSFSDITNLVAEDCQRDNTLSLKADGTYTYTDAGTACSPSESSTGTWSIDSNGKLNIGSVGPFILNDLSITSFNCSTLVAEADFGAVGGVTIVTEFTFRK